MEPPTDGVTLTADEKAELCQELLEAKQLLAQAEAKVQAAMDKLGC